jgi:hypothetical protein
MEGKEFGGPTPEEMGIVQPENPEGKPEDNPDKEKELVTLQSSDASKYKTGEIFEGGGRKGIIRSIDFTENTITIEVEKPKESGKEEAQTVVLESTDASKYHSGDHFDNGNYAGTVRAIDFIRNTITVELDKKEEEGK